MSRGTLDPSWSASSSAYGAFTLSGGPSQGPSASSLLPFLDAPYPGMARMPVWAPSISLAATLEITVVF